MAAGGRGPVWLRRANFGANPADRFRFTICNTRRGQRKLKARFSNPGKLAADLLRRPPDGDSPHPREEGTDAALSRAWERILSLMALYAREYQQGTFFEVLSAQVGEVFLWKRPSWASGLERTRFDQQSRY